MKRTGLNRLSRTALVSAATVMAIASAAMAETTLRYVPSSIPSTLDPITSLTGVTSQHGYLVYDQLFGVDADLRPQLQMLESYTLSDDKKTWDMVLREGLTFHDGSPVTSKDVVASIDRWAKRDGLGVRLVSAMGLRAEAVDERTFRVMVDVPTDLVITGFAKPLSAPLVIMREQDALGDPMVPVAEIIGSGPYRFVAEEYQAGAKIVYEKFDGYVPRDEPASNMAGGKLAKIDRIEWIGMPDATTAVSALMAGEIDMYESPPMDLVPLLEMQAGLVTRPLSDLGQFGWIRANFSQPPFDKPEARRAVQLLIDQSEVMTVTAGGNEAYWDTCYSFYSCGGLSETEAGADWMRERNVEEAKRLLAEAGYNGERIVYLAPGDNAIINGFAQVVVPRLQEGGLNVDMQVSDFSSMMARRSNRGTPDEGGWNLFGIWSFTFEADNPATMAYMNTACDESTYIGWYCNQEMLDLRDDWMRSTDPEEQRAKLVAIQEIAAQEMPVFLLGKFYSPVSYSDRLDGVLNTLQPVFWNIDLKN